MRPRQAKAPKQSQTGRSRMALMMVIPTVILSQPGLRHAANSVSKQPSIQALTLSSRQCPLYHRAVHGQSVTTIMPKMCSLSSGTAQAGHIGQVSIIQEQQLMHSTV